MNIYNAKSKSRIADLLYARFVRHDSRCVYRDVPRRGSLGGVWSRDRLRARRHHPQLARLLRARARHERDLGQQQAGGGAERAQRGPPEGRGAGESLYQILSTEL